MLQTASQFHVSPTVSERIIQATTNVNKAAQADEDALRSLLGLSSAMNQQELSGRQTPPHLSQIPQFPPSQPPAQIFNRNFEPPHIAPQPQRVHQFPNYDSPEIERRMLPEQLQQPRQMPMGYGPPQGGPMYQQPQQPQYSSFSPPHPPEPSFGQRQPAPRAAPAQAKSNFVSAPLMPSVLLNKNRSFGASAKSPNSALSPPQQPQNGLPSPNSSYSHLSPQARLGAQSIPPPPVPPVESRPVESQALAQSTSQSSFDQALKSPEKAAPRPLESSTGIAILDEALKRSHLYQKPSNPNQPPLDRQAFRGQLVGLMQVS